jgi:hypothetical protein
MYFNFFKFAFGQSTGCSRLKIYSFPKLFTTSFGNLMYTATFAENLQEV